ncbi:MAG: hypothetical protein ABI035_01190 [Gemmatimonadaceae bacterium]
MRRIISAGCAAALLSWSVACQKSDQSAEARSASSGVPARVSGDSIVIRTKDGAMQLGLVNDTVFMGLTDSVLTAAGKDMASDTEETKSAIGRAVERFVKNGVNSALHTRLKYPLADIDSAHYSDGGIKFAYRDRRKMGFEDVKQNHQSALYSFTPEDAQKFVSTVNDAILKVRGTSR